MAHWIHYKYNKNKGRYERKQPSRWRHLVTAAQHLLSGTIIGALLLYAFVFFIGSPGEWKLQRDHKRLQQQYKLLDERLDEALGILEDIGERDDNMYRVILQGEPIGQSIRSRIEASSHRYDSLMDLSDANLAVAVSLKMDLIEKEMYVQSKSFDELVSLARNQEDRLKHIPAIQPVSDKDLKYMASGYGWRLDPVYNVMRFHQGMDFSAPKGTDIFATGDGTVTEAGWNTGYGQKVVVNHGYGYTTVYAHLSKISVRRGQKVHRGDKIGEVGSTGKSTGPHCHYEVRLNDVPQNPARYYYYDLTPEQYAEMIEKSENVGQVMD